MKYIVMVMMLGLASCAHRGDLKTPTQAAKDQAKKEEKAAKIASEKAAKATPAAEAK